MNRRAVIGVIAGAVASATARAQPMPVIGYLHTQSNRATEAATAGFRKGLSEGGFIEGRNVALEYNYADGRISELPALAAELVRRNVGVIAAMGGSRAALAAKAVTSALPI